MKKQFFLLLGIFFWFQSISAQYKIPSKMKWWYGDRFGMFIHFGSYSYLGHGEWVFYTEGWTKEKYQDQVSSKFNPVNFNAGTIVRLAQKAGMKYLVITAKHHEGFCMWDTEVESFLDVSGAKPYDLPGFTVFKERDILKELKDSCDAAGIKFCLYYSILDWSHSSQKVNKNYFSDMVSFDARTKYIADMKIQLKELVDKYHPAILWFDGDWTYNNGTPTLSSWWTKNDGTDLYKYVVGLDSNIIVNERVFRGAGLGDFENPEQKVPDAPPSRQWETNQTMNGSWGYNANDNNYKTTATLIRELVDVVSKDGNYLLNIGPKGDGTVPEKSATGLSEIGKWMDVYNESIYGATRSPYKTSPSWGRFTKKEGKLYAHVFSWPINGVLKVPSLENAINKIYLLNDTNTLLNYKDSLGYLNISVPGKVPNTINSVVVIDVAGVPVASTEFIKTTSITLKGKNGVNKISLPGDTLRILSTVSPSDATDKSVSWSVSDSSIASISKSGLLTAKKDGKVTVLAIANDGSEVRAKIVITISGQTEVTSLNIQNKVHFFPNPVNQGILYVKQTLGFDVVITIFDMDGKKVLEKNVDMGQTSLNVSMLLPGTYSLVLSTTMGVIRDKLIIE